MLEFRVKANEKKAEQTKTSKHMKPLSHEPPTINNRLIHEFDYLL